MKSSIVTLAAVTATLVAAAPAAAISGSAGSVDASAAQYVSPSSSVPVGEETPAQGSAPQAIPLGEETPGQGSAPAAVEVPEAVATAPLQSEDSLPFTGYLVITVLLAGIAALLAGLVLRRMTAPGRAAA